jgi:Flp pilus assembly protein TadG
MIEFMLVGLPLLFTILAIVQMSVGMWTYNALASTVDQAARYATVKGGGTVGNVAQTIVNDGPGLVPGKLNVTLASSNAASVPCNPVSSCVGSAVLWPTGAAFADTVTISGTYPFTTPLAIFWPSAGPMKLAGSIVLGASSTQLVQ